MSLISDSSNPRIGHLVVIGVTVICAVAVIGVTAVAAAIKAERKSSPTERIPDIRRSTISDTDVSTGQGAPTSKPPAAPTRPPTARESKDDRAAAATVPFAPAPVSSAPVATPSKPAALIPTSDAPPPSATVPSDPGSSIPLVRDPVPTAVIYKSGLATMFWVGEPAGPDNGYIHNRSSAWDEDWEKSYGGFDDPMDRCAYWPCAFKPHENPFYFALPYNDLDDEGERKSNAIRIPWYDPNFPQYRSQLKDRWIEARNGNTVCYGQWEDVGPFEEDDIEYVFGQSAVPKNKVDLKAGIDLSPAFWDCLRLDTPRSIQWRFVEADAVPKGVWKDIITGN